MSETFSIGLERCLVDPPAVLLGGARFGLLMNQASVDRGLRYACDLLARRFPGQLVALFSPQHGLWGEEQANMIESPHSRYEPLDLPVYSLYSQTRRPTAEMLRGLDCLLVDLQDVGTRVYTFAWTVQQCLLACAEAEIPIVILDRPNPLGGAVEGPLLEPTFQSFVGGCSIPLRHGLTLGELARLMNHEQRIGARLQVVQAAAWRRELWHGRPWIAPSPNMPRLETALVYPGQVLLEGTNLSEGRGTTLPFELAGAPFIDPYDLVRALERFDHPGLALRPLRFVPTFDKWRGERCGGVALQVTQPAAVRSVATTLALIGVASSLYPQQFAWLPPPYEYEREKLPIDILFGSPGLRQRLASGEPLGPDDIASLTALDEPQWLARTRPSRLYESGL
ncbi:MAG: DUF1343 domain-containing protein [Pirellulaceae bacterium]